MKKTNVIMIAIIIVLSICMIAVLADKAKVEQELLNTKQELETVNMELGNVKKNLDNANDTCKQLESQRDYWNDLAYDIALTDSTDNQVENTERTISDEYQAELNYNSQKNEWGR